MGQENKKSQRQKITLIEMPSPAQPANGTEAPDEETEENDQSEQILQSGSVTMTKAKHVIHCLTIVGQIEGHYILPPHMNMSFHSWWQSNRTLPSRD